MLCNAAISSVIRTAAFSAYCDERGPKLNCRGGQGLLLSQTTHSPACKLPLWL